MWKKWSIIISVLVVGIVVGFMIDHGLGITMDFGWKFSVHSIYLLVLGGAIVALALSD